MDVYGFPGRNTIQHRTAMTCGGNWGHNEKVQSVVHGRIEPRGDANWGITCVTWNKLFTAPRIKIIVNLKLKLREYPSIHTIIGKIAPKKV